MTVDTLSNAQERDAAETDDLVTAVWRAVDESPVLKQDVDLVESALKFDIQLLRSDLMQVKTELEAKIEQLRSTLMTWSIGTNLTLAAIIIAALKL